VVGRADPGEGGGMSEDESLVVLSLLIIVLLGLILAVELC
jgi:hypothetical protein